MKNNLFTCALLMAAVSLGACSHMPSWLGGRKDTTPKLSGDRLQVLPQIEIKPTAELANMPVVLPETFANDAWPQHTGGFTATTSNLVLSTSDGSTQSATVGDGEEFDHMLVPRPVVAQGMVFAMDGAGFISAHDAHDISNIRWESAGVSEEDEPKIIGGGLAYDNGKLYAVSGRGWVAALDAATGNPLWRKSTHIPFRSAPKVSADKLYAVSIDSQVYAFSAASGDILWSQRGIRETAGILRSVSPVVTAGMVIVPFPSGEIYAVSAEDGRELWSDSLAIPLRGSASAVFAGIGGDPVVDGEVVFAVSSSGLLSVYNIYNGQKIWAYPVSSLNTPWIVGDYLYLLTNDNTLVSFVKYDGRVRWTTQLPSYEDEEHNEDPILWSGPVMAEGNLLVVGSHGRMLLVSGTDGSIAGEREIEDGIYTAPVVAGGMIYLQSGDASLYALK